MAFLRSRYGIVVLSAGAVALLSLPVVATGKGPPDVVGGGTDTATTVVPTQANVPDTPPGQLHAPGPASKPEPPGHAKSPGESAAPAPPSPAGQGPPREPPGPGRGASRSAQNRHGPKSKAPPASVPEQPATPAQQPVAPRPADEGAEPGGAVEKPSRSESPGQPERSGAPESSPQADANVSPGGAVAEDVASEAIDLPEDASPDTLPFTGLQVALLGMAGVAAIAGGAVLRRRVQRGRA